MTFLRQLRPVGDYVPLAPIGRLADAILARKLHADSVGLEFPGYRVNGYGSGTQALAAALIAARELKNSTRPEVILPAYACPDLVSAAEFANIRSVLADTLPGMPWLDPHSVARCITPDTVAVVSVRFLGMAANDKAIRAVVGENGPVLIEDMAHAFFPDRHVTSSADFVVLSFGRGKPLSIRHGGALLQPLHSRFERDESAVPRTMMGGMAALRHWMQCAAYNFFIQPAIYWLLVRIGKMRTDTIALRHLDQLEKLPSYLVPLVAQTFTQRVANDRLVERELRSLLHGLAGPWVDLADLVDNHTDRGTCSAGLCAPLWRYPLLLPSETQRDRLYERLWRRGLGPSRMYNRVLAEMPGTSELVRGGPTPAARDFSRRLLTLPTHSDVTSADCAAMRACLEEFIVDDGQATYSP